MGVGNIYSIYKSSQNDGFRNACYILVDMIDVTPGFTADALHMLHQSYQLIITEINIL